MKSFWTSFNRICEESGGGFKIQSASPRKMEGQSGVSPRSIQDRVLSAMPASGFEIPTTVPASSGTVRRLVLVQSQRGAQWRGRPKPGLDSAGANEAVLESQKTCGR